MKKRRIAIDGRELEGKPTGVGNYLLNILHEMHPPGNTEIQIFFKEQIPSCTFSYVEPVLLRSEKKNMVWLHTVLASELRKRNVDLFFSPTPNCLPMFGAIQTATVHDLSYFHYPEWFSSRERWSRKAGTRYALYKARRIYVVSARVLREITQRFGTSREKLLITPNGVHPKKVDAEMRRILRKSYGHTDSKIVLYVGSIFQRRHVPVLIESMSRLDENVKLVVIGDNRTFPYVNLNEVARKHGVDSRVMFLEYASSKTVEDYYRMSDVFVYLSTYEGFGVPPLEAMSFGVPVVLSRTPAMDEIYQNSALFVPEIAATAVADSVRACLNDPSLRERLVSSGFAHVERSSWAETATIIANDWEQLLAARS